MGCVHHVDTSKQDQNQASYDALIKDYKASSDGNSIEKIDPNRCVDSGLRDKVNGALVHINSKIENGNATALDRELLGPLKKEAERLNANQAEKPVDPRVQVARDWGLTISPDQQTITVPGTDWSVAKAYDGDGNLVATMINNGPADKLNYSSDKGGELTWSETNGTLRIEEPGVGFAVFTREAF